MDNQNFLKTPENYKKSDKAYEIMETVGILNCFQAVCSIIQHYLEVQYREKWQWEIFINENTFIGLHQKIKIKFYEMFEW